MPTDLLHSLLTNIWSIFLIILFFGGSVFVHELGHFLAARSRGVHVEQFSIGFGPAIFKWRGQDGVEYRIGCLPLGGYVLLPQLADLSAIEGEARTDLSKLPPVGYLSKVIVFSAGAVFNVIFAFLLACVITMIGVPEALDQATTKIGYVAPTMTLPDHRVITSPAAAAGLRPGDVVKAIDGTSIDNWGGLMQALIGGSGRSPDGHPMALFTIERDGARKDITLYPELSGDDRNRRIGVQQGYDLFVHSVDAGSPAAKAGLKPDDQILSLDGQPEMNALVLADNLDTAATRNASMGILRAGLPMTLTIAPHKAAGDEIGITFKPYTHFAHPSPFDQVADKISVTIKTVWNLINPKSDIGLSKMSGPIGIVHIFRDATEFGIRAVLAITILININFAILNMLPVPVLDGGHILFATIGKLRGQALPIRFVLAAQSVFLVLILTMFVYLSVFDVRRWAHDAEVDRQIAAQEQAAHQAASAATPAKP